MPFPSILLKNGPAAAGIPVCWEKAWRGIKAGERYLRLAKISFLVGESLLEKVCCGLTKIYVGESLLEKVCRRKFVASKFVGESFVGEDIFLFVAG